VKNPAHACHLTQTAFCDQIFWQSYRHGPFVYDDGTEHGVCPGPHQKQEEKGKETKEKERRKKERKERKLCS
jgi:hypothetical protein